MKTAQEFRDAAFLIAQQADAIRPADTDPYAQPRKLIVDHLLSAARQTRALAEAIAEHEAKP